VGNLAQREKQNPVVTWSDFTKPAEEPVFERPLTPTGAKLPKPKEHTSEVLSVNFSPDGKRIVSGSHDETVRVWDAHTGQQALTLRGHTGPVTSVAFSPVGRRIASGSADNTVRVWDATPRPGAADEAHADE
jgi:WD40 repeat protein